MYTVQVFQKARRAFQNNLVTHAESALTGFELTAIEVQGAAGIGSRA